MNKQQRYPEIRFAEQLRSRKGQGIFLIVFFGGMSLGLLSLGIAVGEIGIIIFAVVVPAYLIFTGIWMIKGKGASKDEWFFISTDAFNKMIPVNAIRGSKRQILLHMKLLSVYYKLVIDYIAKNTNLKKYDRQMAHYPCVPYVKMDIYQLLAQNHLDYFYLRNSLCLLSLTGEELQYLNRRYFSGNFDLSEEDEVFVKNTLPKAIKLDPYGDGRSCNMYYGPEHEYYALPNDILVIGLRVDLGNNDDVTELQHEEITDVMVTAQNDVEQLLGIKTFVLEYIDNTVIPEYTRSGSRYHRPSGLWE